MSAGEDQILIDDQPIEDPKLEQAVFGEEVRRFLAEDRIGRYIVAKAGAAMEDGVMQLKDVDPDDPKAIRNIQFKIRVAEAVMGWLGEAIDDGERAAQIHKGEME